MSASHVVVCRVTPRLLQGSALCALNATDDVLGRQAVLALLAACDESIPVRQPTHPSCPYATSLCTHHGPCIPRRDTAVPQRVH